MAERERSGLLFAWRTRLAFISSTWSPRDPAGTLGARGSQGVVCAFGSCRSTLPAFDKPRPRRRVSRRTRWSSSLVVCRLAFFLPSAAAVFCAQSERFSPCRLSLQLYQRYDLGSCIFLMVFWHHPTGVCFLLRIRQRYDLGSCTSQPGYCFFIYEFGNVTI